ncbi:MAG TPA: GyrI-like domain-containing protein [Armatimonadota bacterium]|nr:GyrI-like domain-containing protein [Armatimonadota bacterium]
MSSSIEPRIVEFGPYRVIGMRCVGNNARNEFADLWGASGGFLSRMHEVARPEGAAGIAFGLCRCVPGVTDGTFEYIAAAPAAADAAVPDGMIAALIAAGTYAAFPVAALSELMAAWGAVGPWLAAHPEWQAYCGYPSAQDCDCAHHPAFELYPETFATDGRLSVYVPIRPRG